MHTGVAKRLLEVACTHSKSPSGSTSFPPIDFKHVAGSTNSCGISAQKCSPSGIAREVQRPQCLAEFRSTVVAWLDCKFQQQKRVGERDLSFVFQAVPAGCCAGFLSFTSRMIMARMCDLSSRAVCPTVEDTFRTYWISALQAIRTCFSFYHASLIFCSV